MSINDAILNSAYNHGYIHYIHGSTFHSAGGACDHNH